MWGHALHMAQRILNRVELDHIFRSGDWGVEKSTPSLGIASGARAPHPTEVQTDESRACQGQTSRRVDVAKRSVTMSCKCWRVVDMVHNCEESSEGQFGGLRGGQLRGT